MDPELEGHLLEASHHLYYPLSHLLYFIKEYRWKNHNHEIGILLMAIPLPVTDSPERGLPMSCARYCISLDHLRNCSAYRNHPRYEEVKSLKVQCKMLSRPSENTCNGAGSKQSAQRVSSCRIKSFKGESGCCPSSVVLKVWCPAASVAPAKLLQSLASQSDSLLQHLPGDHSASLSFPG